MGSREDEEGAHDDEKPRFRCRVPDLAVAATPVTRRQWAVVMGEERGDGPIDGPVNRVTWFDAARFANWMSNGQPTGAQTPRTTENGAYDLTRALARRGIAVRRNALSVNAKPHGSTISRPTPKHAAMRMAAPRFWGMSG
jgi:hypothetical protein